MLPQKFSGKSHLFQPAVQLGSVRLFPLFWLLIAFTVPGFSQGGGEQCLAIDNCGRLKLDIKPVYTNVLTTCPASPGDCGSDRFHQMVYLVRLKYTAPNSSSPVNFKLSYKSLDVLVGLEIASPSRNFSFIDIAKTENCFASGNGASWGDQLTVTEKTVSLNLSTEDGSTSDCGGDVVHFVSGGSECGTGVYCAYADLFMIVVNAYAGETIGIDCLASSYISYDGNTACSDISCSGGNNVTTISSPSTPASNSENSNVLVRLNSPTTNSNGSCDVQVEVVNNNTSSSVTTQYMEFLVKVAMDQQMEPLTVTSSYDRPVLEDGMNRYIHFIVPADLTLNANGGTQLLGTITVNPPTLINQDWSATLSLIDDTKSRLESNTACTRLPLSSTTRVCEHDGAPACSSLDLDFVISGESPVDCNNLKVKVGFETSSPPMQISLSHLEFQLEFNLSDGVEISGVDFGDWFSTCPHSISDSYCSFSTGTCYEIMDGNILHFCFNVSASSPIYFSLNPGAYMEVLFTVPNGACVNGVKLTSLEILPTGSSLCIPNHPNPDNLPVCMPNAHGHIATETNAPVESVNVAMDDACNVSCNYSMVTSDPGDYGLCPAYLLDCQSYVLTPTRDDNYMNGVSTFDLVLMSKHILGITFLDSPYKIIAADINHSNSLTTFDIVELRKLILGIYSDLPNNTSWRFFDKSFSFNDPTNPFEAINLPFPETVTIDFSSQASYEVNFIGIKVGDVNNSVIANRPAERPEYTIDFSLPETARSGDVLTIPVRYTGSEPLQAFQLALRFDPARMQLLSPSTGDLPGCNAGNFGLTDVQTGVIRALWFADFNEPGQSVEPGAVLFYLSFKMLEKGQASLALDPDVLPCLAWKLDDAECTLRSETTGERSAAPATGSLQAGCRPNPTSGEVVFSVDTEQAGKGRIAVFGPYGNRVWVRDVQLTAGKQDIPVSDIAGLPAGVYVWKVYAGGKKVQGHLIKQ